MRVSRCPACGQAVIWAVDRVGTRIPLDPKAPVYLVRSLAFEDGRLPVERGDQDVAMVVHWSTCKAIRQPSEAPDRAATASELEALAGKYKCRSQTT